MQSTSGIAPLLHCAPEWSRNKEEPMNGRNLQSKPFEDALFAQAFAYHRAGQLSTLVLSAI
jgi:hypothetical protein